MTTEVWKTENQILLRQARESPECRPELKLLQLLSRSFTKSKLSKAKPIKAELRQVVLKGEDLEFLSSNLKILDDEEKELRP